MFVQKALFPGFYFTTPAFNGQTRTAQTGQLGEEVETVWLSFGIKKSVTVSPGLSFGSSLAGKYWFKVKASEIQNSYCTYRQMK